MTKHTRAGRRAVRGAPLSSTMSEAAATQLDERLSDAQRLLEKWCQPGALTLPEVKARLPSRDAPYEEHTQPDDAWTGFRVRRRLPIPGMVFETITSRAPVATLALFPEIARACITVEKRLYLWDYARGEHAFEFHELPSDDLILSVGLVRVRPGVFVDTIQHVLVLSIGPTAVEGRRVVLLGIQTTDTGIKLYETGMQASTNGVVMRSIHGTDTGRVFCVGSDQCVHELVYQAQEGWFYSRCYLRNITQPHLANLLPSFFKADKKISMVSVDNARRLLYVLRDGDQIDVYALGHGRVPSHTGSMYGVTRQAGLLHSQQQVGPIIWLGPTEPDPRSSVCLVAVTERGYRLYLDDFQRRSWAQLAVRIPPGTQPCRATSALYADGVFLCACASGSDAQLYAVGPSTPASNTTLTYASGMHPAWQEGATLIPLGVGGAPPVLAEAPHHTLLHGAVSRPCAAQVMAPARTFYVLDANGLTEIVERRPADVLSYLLLGSAASVASVASAPAMVDFFSRHGPVEACMCALALAAQHPYMATSRPDDVAHAIRVFFGPLGAWPAEQRVPAPLHAPRSARLEALACYLACLVRPVWLEPLVPAAFVEAKASGAPPIVGRLAGVLAHLAPLHAFLQRHTQLFDDERAERLGALLTRTMEACHFVLFLADHHLGPLAQALSPGMRAKLTSLTLAGLVATSEGRSVAQALVTALIESQSGARASVDAIAEALQAQCASFCSADDVRQYKASECLRHAVELDARLRAESSDSTAVTDELAHSLRLLLPGAAHLPWDKFEHVCTTYEQLRYATGVVALGLASAHAVDPADAAVSFRADGCPADEPMSHRHAMYALRRRIYALVLRALRDDAEAMRQALASDDALFHEELYTYMIAHGKTSELLSTPTPFLEDFLQGTPVLLDGQSLETYERRLRDLLWQWYVRQGEYLAAAQTLDALAHTDTYALHLYERIEYLALAVGNAKSVRQTAAYDLVGFATQLEEDLEVAQVQAKILSALPPVETLELDDTREHTRETAALLDRSLMDITTLYRHVAEPFGLLEEQLLILHTAQYHDASLVASLWEALVAREHNASAPAQAHRAVAALVTDVYVRLGGSHIACAVDIVLPLLERYAYDTYVVAQLGEQPAPSSLHWHAFSKGAGLPPGWAPRVLLEAGAPPDALFHVLQGLLSTAPAPWNTHTGVGYLLPDLADLADAWLRRAEHDRHVRFPAHEVEQALNDAVLQLTTRRFTRTDDALDARIEHIQALVHRVRRRF